MLTMEINYSMHCRLTSSNEVTTTELEFNSNRIHNVTLVADSDIKNGILIHSLNMHFLKNMNVSDTKTKMQTVFKQMVSLCKMINFKKAYHFLVNAKNERYDNSDHEE